MQATTYDKFIFAMLGYIPCISCKLFSNECKLIEEEFFTEEEMSIIKRARNYKSKSHPKNCNIITYRYATALEAVIGYLELKEDKSRINEIMLHILGGK